MSTAMQAAMIAVTNMNKPANDHLDSDKRLVLWMAECLDKMAIEVMAIMKGQESDANKLIAAASEARLAAERALAVLQ